MQSHPNTAGSIENSASISCIIPVYNGKRDLARAVGSALSQRPDVEVVLVDDCSTDGSRDIVLEMARDDPRIVTFFLPYNRGQGYARNLGVTLASAAHITFLDQDDEHAPGWYDYALAYLSSNSNTAAIKGEIELMQLPPDLSVDRTDPRRSAMVYSPIWNVVMHKLVYSLLGGCPSSKPYRTRMGVEDIALVNSLMRHFRVGRTEFLASRHYVQATGATAYFLRRTRVVGKTFEYTQTADVERDGTLQAALRAYQDEAAASVATLRDLLGQKQAGADNRFGRYMTGVLQRLIRS